MINDTSSSTNDNSNMPQKTVLHGDVMATPLRGSETVRRRTDAVQNHTKLLDAAEAVFLESGVNASLELVAERAGVGRATLFRNFADRGALIMGLLSRAVTELEDVAASIDEDALALGRLLHFMAKRIVMRAPLQEIWMTLDHDHPALLGALARVETVFEKPVALAVAGGACRSDLMVSDVILLISMLRGALYARTPTMRSRMVERGWVLVCEAARLNMAPISLGNPVCECG
jgi:AcrR family transcriptional regulator